MNKYCMTALEAREIAERLRARIEDNFGKLKGDEPVFVCWEEEIDKIRRQARYEKMPADEIMEDMIASRLKGEISESEYKELYDGYYCPARKRENC